MGRLRLPGPFEAVQMVGASGCEGEEAEVEMNRTNVEMMAAQERGAEIDIGDHNLELY